MLQILTEGDNFLLHGRREGLHGCHDLPDMAGSIGSGNRSTEQVVRGTLKSAGKPRQEAGGRVADAPLDM